MIKTVKLKSGARLIMERIPHVQSVAMGIWTATGAADEDSKYAGISHVMEHMSFKGTPTRNAKKLAEDMERLGAQTNAFTGKEATCYYVKTLSQNMKATAEIFLDMFLNPALDPSELSREKRVICEEIKMIEDSPDELVNDMISEVIFKGEPLANNIAGTASSLKNISRPVLAAYREQQYTANSIVVSAAGNFDEDELVACFDHAFDKLRAKKAKRSGITLPYEPRSKVRVKDIEQTHICLGAPSVSLKSGEYVPVSVLAFILGGSMSSRLFQRIREEKGLAYTVYSALNAGMDKGYLSVYAAVSHDNVRRAIDAIREELEDIGLKDVSPAELDLAKTQLKGSYIFGQENVSTRMYITGKNLLYTGKVEEAEEVLAAVDAVTLRDVRRMAEKYCDFGKYSAAIVSGKRVDAASIMKK